MRHQSTILTFSVFTLLCFQACMNDTKRTPSGLSVKMLEKGKGKQAERGNVMQLHYEFRNESGAVLKNAAASSDSMLVELKDGGFRMMTEVLAMLHEGDSVEALFPADSVYNRILRTNEQGPLTDRGKIRWNVRLKKIFTKDDFNAVLATQMQEYRSRENQMIATYLSDNGFVVPPLKSGLVYIEMVPGNGKTPVPGDRVTVKYTARFFSGEVVDASEKGVEFVLGTRSMIAGWDEGIAMMKENGKSRLVIPSRLAYGTKGYGPIPPNTPVVYDVELVKVQSSMK